MRPDTSGTSSTVGLRRLRVLLTLLMALSIAAAGESVFARGGSRGHAGAHHSSGTHSGSHHGAGARVGLGFVVAAPLFGYYSPAPYYDYAPLVPAPSAPPIYIEQGIASSAPDLPAGYWYYCAEARAYYPDVKECAGTWQPVAPQPSPAQ